MDPDFSREALAKFLEMIESKGLGNAHTVGALKVASSKILGDLSPDEEADVRKVDVRLAVKRYNNKNPNLLSPRSLAEYERRTALAIREFVRYHDDPRGYEGIGRGAPTRPDRSEKKPRKAESGGTETAVPVPTPQAASPTSSGLSLAFPLRQDFLAQVVLPRDLKSDEARRLAAFIATLAVDYKVD